MYKINYVDEAYKYFGQLKEEYKITESKGYGNTLLYNDVVKYRGGEWVEISKYGYDNSSRYYATRIVTLKYITGNTLYKDVMNGKSKSKVKIIKLINAVTKQIAEVEAEMRLITSDSRYTESYKEELIKPLVTKQSWFEDVLSNLEDKLKEYTEKAMEKAIERMKKQNEKLYLSFIDTITKGSQSPNAIVKRIQKWQEKNNVSTEEVVSFKAKYKNEIESVLDIL